jgi:predicted nucleic acid-binding protein
MIAADTNVVIGWLENRDDPVIDRFGWLLRQRLIVLPPVVVTELWSAPSAQPGMGGLLAGLTVLPIVDGYWERAGLLRARLFAQGRRARLGDALIAQSCLDADAALLTRDEDFAAFEPLAGLKRA